MIRVLGDRVLVALPPREAEIVSTGGIVLVRDPELRAQTRGIVMQLGEKSDSVDRAAVLMALDELCAEAESHEGGRVDGMCCVDTLVTAMSVIARLASAPFDVQVGDLVLFSAGDGEELSVDGIDYVILREADILGVVEPLEKATV